MSQSLGLGFYLAVSQSLEVIKILYLLNWANIFKNVAVLHAVEENNFKPVVPSRIITFSRWSMSQRSHFLKSHVIVRSC